MAFVGTVLASCNGGGGDSPSSYWVAGTVSGLGSGRSVVLQNNGGDDLTVGQNGSFRFASKVSSSGAYAVTVKTHPAGQSCQVSGGAGTVSSSDVTTVTVTCTMLEYSVGGTVIGLVSGRSLVLQDNGGDDLTVSAEGAFTFGTKVRSGSPYAVTVKTQPLGQSCEVVAGSGTVEAADVTSVSVTCAIVDFSVGGTVSGLATGRSLVLQNNGADDLTVQADGAFAFAGRLAQGAAYLVTVRTHPLGQVCAVTGGSGTVAAADVTTIVVTCAAETFAIRGTVSGLPASASIALQNNGADNLTVSANGAFAFATRLPSGAAYAVTILTLPAGQTCSIARGTGIVAQADVTDVAVSCAPTTFAIGGTAAGVTAAGLVLHNTFQNEDLTVAANAVLFAFAARAPAGTAYTVTVKSSPTGLGCAVTNGTGTVPSADVTNIAVTCSSTILAWTPPTTWGGFWQDSPTMVQHAHFDATGIVSDKGPTFSMVGGLEPAPFALTGFPSPVGTRYAGGPFPQEAVSYRAANASALDLTGNLLVCAVVRPARNRPYDSFEGPIIAKGVGDGKYTVNAGGWVLMQMHESWCFHYEYKDSAGGTHQFMASIPNLFADQDFHGHMVPPQPLPEFQPDPSYVVVCGGRSGDDIVVAANAWDPSTAGTFSLTRTQDQTAPNPFPSPYTLDAATSVPATIGGYHMTSAELRATAQLPTDPEAFQGDHIFKGYVFETAVWNEPATAANVRAKMQAFLGTASANVYLRNREAAYAEGGKLHIASRHAPRVDPARGQLFGLQSWNRVAYWVDGSADYVNRLVFAAGENLSLWTATPATGAGAPTVQLDATVHPPNDSPITPAQRVTLPPGASLSIALDQALPPLAGPPSPTPSAHDRLTWDRSGPVQGQIWLRPASGGTLRIQKTDPQPGRGASCTVLGAATQCEQKDVAMGGLTANQWNRVSLNGSFTADARESGGVTTNRGTLVLTNAGASPVTFYAWGVQLTQLGGGGDPGAFDAAELMYDWNGSRSADGETSDDPFFPIDVLRLAPVATSTASSGFCLGAEATMPTGLAWNAPFAKDRTAVAWVNDPASFARTARVFVRGADGSPNAGRLCFEVTGATGPACGAIPAAWSAGSKHTVKGCMSAAGQLRVYGDDAQLATATAGVATPDVSGGTVLVGNGDFRPVTTLTPWHGYVSRAVACRDTGNAADCR